MSRRDERLARKLTASLKRSARWTSYGALCRLREALVPPIDVELVQEAVHPWETCATDTLVAVAASLGEEGANASFVFVQDKRGNKILTDAEMASLVLAVRRALAVEEVAPSATAP